MRAIALTAALAALLLAPAGAAAAGAWGPAETVSRAGGVPGRTRGMDRPRAAIDARGTAVLAWTGPGRSAREGAFGARRVSARGFGVPFGMRVQDRLVEMATVQASAAGDFPIAWRRFLVSNHRVESTTVRRSGARTGGPISLSGPGSSAYEPEFAAVAAGTLPAAPVLTWSRRETGRAQLARAVGGRLLAGRNVRVPGAIGARYVQRPDGRLVAAAVPDENGSVVAVDADAADAFGTPVVVAAGPGPFREADIAVAPDGAVAVAWREYDGATYRARVALRPAGAAAFGAPVTLSGAGERALGPRVDITSDGTVRVAWLSGAPGDDRAKPTLGPLVLATVGGATQTVTPSGGGARSFDIGADGRGGQTLAWQRRQPGRGPGAIFARAVTPGGALGRAQRLTFGAERGVSLDLAVGPRGDAVAAWTNAAGTRLRAAYRPAG
jgi:hypothetical protein